MIHRRARLNALTLLSLAVLGCAVLGCRREGAPSDPYLDLVAQDPHGRTLRFADFAGKVRVVDLWASWCGPCRVTIPELNALHERYHDRGLVVLGISVDDDPAAVLEFERAVPIRYPTGLFNPRLAERLGQPSAIPTTLLIDRRGVLRRTFVGFVDAATLEQEIAGLL
ncbi:MAG TPA: TlpA disulfide reductase family protein [Candidatus Cryosericum sp.]|nr:TlpA disulfide reductase family protein [Candidatus Cryosericum sp.]